MLATYNKKRGYMKNFTSNLPEPFLGLIYILFSIVILLDAIGAIHATLLVVVGACLGWWYGFLLIQGPKKIRNLLGRIQINNKSH
jgi:hypothetical protein